MPDWSVRVVNGPLQSGAGSLVGEFAPGVAQVSSVKYVLNDSDQASFSIPTLDAKATLIDSEKHEIQIWRDAQMMFWGPIVSEPDVGPERTSFNCMGAWEYFKYRFVHRNLSYNADQLTIAWNLVNYAQTEWAGAALKVDPATFSPSGVTRALTYLGADHASIAGAVTDLTKLTKGFDFSVELVGGNRREWTPHYPSKGTLKSDKRLIYDQRGSRGIETFNAPRDGTRRANWATVTGTGAGSLKLEQIWVDAAARDSSVLWQAIESMTDIKTAAVLLERAKAEVAARKKFIQIPRLTLKETADVRFIGQIAVGDRLPVDVDYGRAQLHGDYRIVALDIKPGDAEYIDLELNVA